MATLVSVQYIGHHPAVEIDLDGLGEQIVVKEQIVKVPAELANSLAEQVANWKIVNDAPAPIKSKPEEAK